MKKRTNRILAIFIGLLLVIYVSTQCWAIHKINTGTMDEWIIEKFEH